MIYSKLTIKCNKIEKKLSKGKRQNKRNLPKVKTKSWKIWNRKLVTSHFVLIPISHDHKCIHLVEKNKWLSICCVTHSYYN